MLKQSVYVWSFAATLILSQPMLCQYQNANIYLQRNLVSDTSGVADRVDLNLVNPRGLAFSASGPFWVANEGSGTATVYNSVGVPAPAGSPLIIAIPRPAGSRPGHASPTGEVSNATGEFFLPGGQSATFIFATADGTIAGWNSAANATSAITVVDHASSGAVYTALAIATNGAGNFLCVANFRSGRIEVFDRNFNPAMLSGSFTDANIPSGFAPFNIQNLGGKLYVTYAEQDPTSNVALAGAGNGYVNVFDVNGNFLQRLASQGTLNAPWGMAVAPPNFGFFSNTFLVANSGDGTINGFDPSSGAFLGQLRTSPSAPAISIPGIWAIAIGNSGQGGDPNFLYFTAGPSNGTHGIFGSIQGNIVWPPPQVPPNSIVNGASFSAASSSMGGAAPGTIASLFGSYLSPVIATANMTPLPTELMSTSVLINGKAVPLFFISPGQINFQVPADLSPSAYAIQVVNSVQGGNMATITIAGSSPGIFTTNQAGTGQGAILNARYALVDHSAPATTGDIVLVYCTGLGVTTPPVATGSPGPVNSPAAVNSAITATVGGIPAQVVSATAAPGFVGLYQVNVAVPAGAPVGDAVAVILTQTDQSTNALNKVSSNAATMAIR